MVFGLNLSPEDLAAGAKPVLQILDVRGRSVATVPVAFAVGPQQLRWDGALATGQRAPAGLYFARLRVGTKLATRKFVRVAP